MSKTIFKKSFLLSIFAILSGLIGYVYQIIMGRELAPADYSIFISSLGLIVFLSAPSSALVLIVARSISYMKVADGGLDLIRPLYFHILKIVGTIGGCGIFVAAIFGPTIFRQLNWNYPDNIYLIFTGAFLISLSSINYAFFQGLQLFKIIVVLGLMAGILKILFSTSLI